MVIAVGSTNRIKVEAVEEVIKSYPDLASAHIKSFSVPSGVSDQPLSLDEIIRGAQNRAKNAFIQCASCSYSFGLESGLFPASGTSTGFLEASICCIYDGTIYHTGLSCGFEVPHAILDLVINQKMDLAQACYHAGITTNTKLGSSEGLIGLLSKGRINRKEYTKQSIITALFQLENQAWYNKK